MIDLVCKGCGATIRSDRLTICKCTGRVVDGDAPKQIPVPKPPTEFQPPINCIHRGHELGAADCGCAGKSKVHWCNLFNGHCTVRATGKTWNRVSTEDGKIDRIGRIGPCSVCDKRLMAHDLVTLKQPTILSELPVPTRARALITVAPDEHSQSELRFTREPMQRYAARLGLDYVEVTDLTSQPHKCGNKYAYAEVAKRYEQSLWLDPDIVIMDNAPNIFDAVPVGSWGLVDDLSGLGPKGNNYSWFKSEWTKMNEALELDNYEPRAAWNAGMVVAPTEAYKSYHPPTKPVPDFWCIEQHYFGRCLIDDNARIVELGREWNTGYWDPSFLDRIATGYFIHLGGCKPHSIRLQLLEHFAAGHRDLPEFVDAPTWTPKWMASKAQ